MTEQEIQGYIDNPNIKITGLRSHAKASEKYVDVLFSYPNQEDWNGSIPFHYRRTGLFLESPDEIAELVEKSYEAIIKDNSDKWIAAEKHLWETDYKGKTVTRSFFEALLNLQWNSVDGDLPANPNWARRIQDIKEMGYLLATYTNRYDNRLKKNTTQILLIPLARGAQSGYETISPALKKRIIKVLGSYDAYEGKVRPAHFLLPDHKFPEISWDEHTRVENSDDMSDDEIKAKFQLLDNQRNLEKREACRKVIQTGKVGTIFGIQYYMAGNDQWPSDIPMVGVKSEAGWKLCPWYDIEAWRRSLNDLIKKNCDKNKTS